MRYNESKLRRARRRLAMVRWMLGSIDDLAVHTSQRSHGHEAVSESMAKAQNAVEDLVSQVEYQLEEFKGNLERV